MSKEHRIRETITDMKIRMSPSLRIQVWKTKRSYQIVEQKNEKMTVTAVTQS
jgi:hypothetical protein